MNRLLERRREGAHEGRSGLSKDDKEFFGTQKGGVPETSRDLGNRWYLQVPREWRKSRLEPTVRAVGGRDWEGDRIHRRRTSC